MKILSFGEILFDVFDGESKIGGAPFNFAAHAARRGAESYLVSAVGFDALGDLAVKTAERYGVNASYISRSEKYGTGVCRVTLDGRGIPHYELLYPSAYDDVKIDADITAQDFDGLYFGTLALRDEQNRLAVKSLTARGFREILVDVNVRRPFFNSDALNLAVSSATILKISDEELSTVMTALFGSTAESLTAAARQIGAAFKNIKLVIITKGADGSIVYDAQSGEFFGCAAVKANVVSTVGAGDSYSAAFFVDYLNGVSVPECMERASAVSAYVVSHLEAIPD